MRISSDKDTGLKVDAEVLRRCLELGIVDRHEVISWADRQIERLDHPDASICEVALAVDRSATDLVGLLDDIPGESDRTAYLRGLFARLRSILVREPSALGKVTRALERMAIDEESLSPDAENAMYRFDDAFELARGGAFGDLDAIRKEVLSFLEEASAGPKRKRPPFG